MKCEFKISRKNKRWLGAISLTCINLCLHSVFFFKPNSLSEVFKIIKNISYLVYRCKNNPVYAAPYPRGLNRSEQFFSNSKIYYALEGVWGHLFKQNFKFSPEDTLCQVWLKLALSRQTVGHTSAEKKVTRSLFELH